MEIRLRVPNFLKPVLRFFYYHSERKKIWKEFLVKLTQNKLIRNYDSQSTSLVLFLIPGAEYHTGAEKITGGRISIVSLCEESQRLKSIHHSEVILCIFPGQYLLAKHTTFKSDIPIFRYRQLPKYFKNVTSLVVHVPEYLCSDFNNLLDTKQYSWLRAQKEIKVNVLNQNIRFMPEPEIVKALCAKVTAVTISTAHQQYCTPEWRDIYKVPFHKMSVWISPEKYIFKKFEEKEDLIIVSPDSHPQKEEILEKIKRNSKMRIEIIQNMSYEVYKEVISRAKFALTFGEGLDGYFIEPVFSGAISFAVYNNQFFTKDYCRLETVYFSYDEMIEQIVADVGRLNESAIYANYQKEQFVICSKHYSYAAYKNNIQAFYRKDYTFPY